MQVTPTIVANDESDTSTTTPGGRRMLKGTRKKGGDEKKKGDAKKKGGPTTPDPEPPTTTNLSGTGKYICLRRYYLFATKLISFLTFDTSTLHLSTKQPLRPQILSRLILPFMALVLMPTS